MMCDIKIKRESHDVLDQGKEGVMMGEIKLRTVMFCEIMVKEDHDTDNSEDRLTIHSVCSLYRIPVMEPVSWG